MRNPFRKDEIDLWRNRRLMAWSATVGSLLFPVLVLLTDSEQLGDVAVPFYTWAGLVVTSYTVSATWEDKTRIQASADVQTEVIKQESV